MITARSMFDKVLLLLALTTLLILSGIVILPGLDPSFTNHAQVMSPQDEAAAPALNQNTWTSGAPMPTARSGAAFGVINGKGYVVSGTTSSAVVNNNEIYNLSTNTWTIGAPIPTPRFVAASAVVNNILYVIGGCDDTCNGGGGATSVVEAYDPVTDSWSEKSPIPTAIDSVYAVAVKGIIYVVGGYVPGEGRVATVYTYNPATDTWAQKASMKVAKSNPATGFLGGIIAAGGFNGGGITDTESYSTGSNKWKTLPPIPTGRYGGCFGVIKGSLYVAGGSNGGSPLSVLEAYVSKTKSWTTGLPAVPQSIVVPASVVYKNKLYCFGGADSGAVLPSTVYDNVQIYQP